MRRGPRRNPETEVIEFNSVIYRRSPGKRYFKSFDDSLHRAIWRSIHGPIPPNHDIHHKDDDWNNNHPDNLECKPARVHHKQHMLAWTRSEAGRANTQRLV